MDIQPPAVLSFFAGLGERRAWLPAWTSKIQVLEAQTVVGEFRGIHQALYRYL